MTDSSTIWQTNTKDHQYKTSNIGTYADKEWNNDFYFVQGADCQLGMMASFEPDYKPETSKWDEEIRLANLAVQKVNRLNPKPRFFIICGDLTHQMPSNEPALIEVKQRQIDDFKKIFSEVDPSIPLVCVCGNHDVGDFPTVESVQKYRSTFGDDYFSFWCGGVLFIVLNSQYYKERTEDVVKLAEEQDRWLDEVLREAKGHRIICFAHVPWFIDDVNEKLGVFNIPMEWRIKMLEKLYSAGVRFMFCGHYHQNGGGFYKDLEVVVTSAIGKQLGKDKSGLRIVKVTKDNVVHKYHEFDTFPTNLNSIL